MEALIWIAIFLMAVSFTLSFVAPRPRRDHRRLKLFLIAVLVSAALICFVLAAVAINILAFVMMFAVISSAPTLLWLDRFQPGDDTDKDDQTTDNPPPIDWTEFDRNRSLWQRGLAGSSPVLRPLLFSG